MRIINLEIINFWPCYTACGWEDRQGARIKGKGYMEEVQYEPHWE
jgi:hypothetical protein